MVLRFFTRRSSHPACRGALLGGFCLLALAAQPTLAQRSGVADTNPRSYAASNDGLLIEQAAFETRQRGAVVVRLPTAANWRKLVSKRNFPLDEPTLRAALASSFTLAPVYVVSAEELPALVGGDLSKAQPLGATPTRALEEGQFLLVDINLDSRTFEVASARNEAIWRPGGLVDGASKIPRVGLETAVANLNRELTRFAVQYAKRHPAPTARP